MKNSQDETASTPRWVKVSAAVLLALALILVAILLVGGRVGGHGPGRHQPGDDRPAGHMGPPPGITHD